MKRILQSLILFIAWFVLSGCTLIIDTPKDPVDNPNDQIEDPKDNEEDNNEDIDFNDYNFLQSKILKINREGKELELLDYGTLNLTDNIKIVQYLDGEIKSISLENLYIGMSNIHLQIHKETNEVRAILLDGEIFFRNIRVAIRNTIDDISNPQTLYHDKVELSLKNAYKIKTFDNKFDTTKTNGKLTITIVNNKMALTSDGEVLLQTDKRIIIEPINEVTSTITFDSISRSNGRKPSYYGSFEIAIENNRLLVINDVYLEDYLRFVVPSEMPANFGIEALKAQAVAARTYAYGDILNRGYEHLGYAVDDSTMSQVYNNSSENNTASNAVRETRRYVMLYNGEPINAFYYSSSAGITASAHEVWITSPELNEPTPYLMGQNLTKDRNGNIVPFDPTDEDNMLAFFKRTDLIIPDNSPNDRWNVQVTKSQLRTMFNQTLQNMYKQYPKLILTKENSMFQSLDIPRDIGEIQDIVVSQRGESGVVISLDIITNKTTYRIINQYNIRFSFSPVLKSGFFAIERNGDKITFYGGGYGHGVGMSQCGARGLASQGYTFKEILRAYYSEIDLIELKYTYTPSNTDMSKIFELIK